MALPAPRHSPNPVCGRSETPSSGALGTGGRMAGALQRKAPRPVPRALAMPAETQGLLSLMTGLRTEPGSRAEQPWSRWVTVARVAREGPACTRTAHALPPQARALEYEVSRSPKVGACEHPGTKSPGVRWPEHTCVCAAVLTPPASFPPCFADPEVKGEGRL